jgi:hypothetical protein
MTSLTIYPKNAHYIEIVVDTDVKQCYIRQVSKDFLYSYIIVPRCGQCTLADGIGQLGSNLSRYDITVKKV